MTSKRKFAEVSESGATSDGSSDKKLRLQQRQVEHLLEEGKKALFKSLKVARGFERQKLGRRQKTAKVDKAEDDLVRLNAEVAALKVCNSGLMTYTIMLIFAGLGLSHNSRSSSVQVTLKDQVNCVCFFVSTPCPSYCRSDSQTAGYG